MHTDFVGAFQNTTSWWSGFVGFSSTKAALRSHLDKAFKVESKQKWAVWDVSPWFGQALRHGSRVNARRASALLGGHFKMQVRMVPLNAWQRLRTDDSTRKHCKMNQNEGNSTYHFNRETGKQYAKSINMCGKVHVCLAALRPWKSVHTSSST